MSDEIGTPSNPKCSHCGSYKHHTTAHDEAIKGLSSLDHPCKQTCSGWKQGYDKGYKYALTQEAVVKELVHTMETATKYLLSCGYGNVLYVHEPEFEMLKCFQVALENYEKKLKEMG